MSRYESIEPEDAPALIHHGTSWPAALAILSQDRLRARRASGIEGAAVSLTTDPATARTFAERRDDREEFVLALKARGYTRHRINQWLDVPGAVTRGVTSGVVLTFDGPRLAEIAALHAYDHYGMEEEELRSDHDIHGIASALVRIEIGPDDARLWSGLLPKRAKAITALASHPLALQAARAEKAGDGRPALDAKASASSSDGERLTFPP